jgi:nucleoid DNA-binding protein
MLYHRSHNGNKKRRGIENIFEEIVAEILPNLKKETNIHLNKCVKFQTR